MGASTPWDPKRTYWNHCCFQENAPLLERDLKDGNDDRDGNCSWVSKEKPVPGENILHGTQKEHTGIIVVFKKMLRYWKGT
jgi:hypothetical protein